MGALIAGGLSVGAFVTDARRQVAGIQTAYGNKALPCIVVAAHGRPIADAAHRRPCAAGSSSAIVNTTADDLHATRFAAKLVP
jgi:hypothetical protein